MTGNAPALRSLRVHRLLTSENRVIAEWFFAGLTGMHSYPLSVTTVIVVTLRPSAPTSHHFYRCKSALAPAFFSYPCPFLPQDDRGGFRQGRRL